MNGLKLPEWAGTIVFLGVFNLSPFLLDWLSMTKLVWEKEKGRDLIATWVCEASCRLVDANNVSEQSSSDRFRIDEDGRRALSL